MIETDFPHLLDPVVSEWKIGNWIVRQEGLGFSLEFIGDSSPASRDIKAQLAIINEINDACLFSVPDPMTDEGLCSQQIRIKERLDNSFNEDK
ncbi:hypothetical protein A3A54_00980 [Candidatus Curtissbacteria bacterium RIFCSPLOWO2_01_FULL_39_62]|uniref:Uncharacterized protein n=2 Tax=Candidatus Curtissiibacteriota TaxID=1752717 RepID=A0A1F5G8J7_9BACT|nr:MAG: hypothetical protein A3D04_01605 [Candidatus Curtissbacteria bacterium RIFCSPHIGHO2_02_FULL_40_16b]OGE00497.1 MAG: hypothetical protein A3J17_05010 [Candidatus Curtissbacteria bacterium RIFCSPLOWO2_02_FULL_40_11]OGE00531.1 MAG: hypothetical protein A3A54_00980 [Candidatus Curtissbacteria bacterium RIFCSPLOWO2_01_FULL_39_62]OGE14101.1 MAG: hypothetical protein A3G14_02300 [Candidatus Curtissbacteria bacterium RIFCSPLOWO2_12_FULL_38_9]